MLIAPARGSTKSLPTSVTAGSFRPNPTEYQPRGGSTSLRCAFQTRSPGSSSTAVWSRPPQQHPPPVEVHHDLRAEVLGEPAQVPPRTVDLVRHSELAGSGVELD